MVSTHLKNISQIGKLPQIEVKIKNIWNHHLVNLNPKPRLDFCWNFPTLCLSRKSRYRTRIGGWLQGDGRCVHVDQICHTYREQKHLQHGGVMDIFLRRRALFTLKHRKPRPMNFSWALRSDLESRNWCRQYLEFGACGTIITFPNQNLRSHRWASDLNPPKIV